jgi:DNA invertase Pin-like site-specific DNA recombinase
MKNYVIYFRVSTKKQGRSGLGLDAQKEIVKGYLASSSGKVLEEFTEIESGKNGSRPELTKALEVCQKNKATLLVAKLDRLSRELHFITYLEKSKIDFICADMPEANRLTIHIFGAMAQHEREIISQRTKQALAQAKKRGQKLGAHLPQVKKALAKAKRKSKGSLSKMAQDFAESLRATILPLRKNGMSQRQIVNILNECDVKTARGSSEWSLVQLQRVMQRLKA